MKESKRATRLNRIKRFSISYLRLGHSLGVPDCWIWIHGTTSCAKPAQDLCKAWVKLFNRPVDRTDYELGFLDREKKVFYVAAPMHYKPTISWLKEHFDFSEAFSLRSISSSYLPDWRPGVDYRKTYSAHKDMGGGVSIDLIHEWDYLQYLIGFPERAYSIIEKRSGLEIDSDDVALYIADYGDKTAEIHLDYFGRVPIRKIEIFTKEDTVECDLLTDSISFLKSGEQIILTEERDDTQARELEAFLDMIQGKRENTNDIEHALNTLILAKGYE